MALSKVSGGQSKGRENVNYGPSKGSHQREQYDAKREQYGNSPWYGRNGEATPMPWAGPEGQERGVRAPFFTPDAGDPRNAGYYVAPPTAAEQGAIDARNAAGNAAQSAAYGADPRIAAARAAGDVRGYAAAVNALKAQGQQQRFMDQGGTAETWQNRHSQPWPVPKVPGAAGGPPPPGGGMPPPPSRSLPPASTQAMAPQQNPMFEGYSQGPGGGGIPGQIGGASGGVFSQMGGGFAPGQSKSGYGQPMMGGGGMSTGMGSAMPMGGMDMMMSQGRGMPPMLPPGFGGGGRQPINPGYQPPVFNPGNRGPSVDQWGGLGNGGYPGYQYGGGSPFEGMGGMMQFGYSPVGMNGWF